MFWAGALAALGKSMFALEVAAEPVSTAILVKWCTV